MFGLRLGLLGLLRKIGAAPVPVIPDHLLKEDGDALLLESGGYILLE